MDQRNKISFDLPIEFKITRPVECPYLDFRMEQRIAADIWVCLKRMIILHALGSDVLKIGYTNLFATIVTRAYLCGLLQVMLMKADYYFTQSTPCH